MVIFEAFESKIVWALIAVLLSIVHRRKKFESEMKGYEYPPSSVGFITWMRARLKPDYPYRALEWSRQMDSPVYRIRFVMSSKFVVFTKDIHLVRQVLKDKESTKPSVYQIISMIHGGGNNILSSDGLFWNHSRKAMAPAFSAFHMKRMKEVVMKKTEEFIRVRLDPMVQKGCPIDICNEMIDLTLGIICEAAFEYDMSDEERNEFKNELPLALEEGVKCFVFPFRLKLGKYISPKSRRALLASTRMIKLATKILTSYRALNNPTRGTVIDQIANNTSYKTDKERASDIMILLLAGHDTTAFSLSWTLLELAKNSNEQCSLRTELRRHKEHERSSLPILRNVVKEGLRLEPVAPFSGRITNKDIIYKREGHSNHLMLPKGTQIVCSNFLLCRNETYFKDPDKFQPSRWEDPSDDALAAFTPFSLGRRNCLGQSLAMAELHYVLARLCSDYVFVVEDEGTPTFSFTWRPKGALLVASKYNSN